MGGQQTFPLTMNVGIDSVEGHAQERTFVTDADAAAPKRRLFRLRVDQRPSAW